VNQILLNGIASVAISTAVAQPSLAPGALAGAPPVSVLSCEAVANYATITQGEQGQSSIPTGATVRIAFVNRSPQTATDVTFLIDEQPITYQGTFSRGVPIQHTFGPYDTVSAGAACDVYAVKFEDGRLWQRP
jgi:hypothetical protein